MTDIELELLTDSDKYLFIEEGLPGGISMISNRFGKANNPYVPDSNPKSETTYVTYFDANNLSGGAMSQSLPTGEFDWLTDQKIAGLVITDVANDSEQGYILEVDLHYPSELHDHHNDCPLSPEKMKTSSEMLSPYCQELSECLNLRGGAVSKLVPNLQDKTNYVVHHCYLKQYLAFGMELTKVQRVPVFQHSPWLKSYIDFKTEKRKQAANDFQKDFYKLMNNSVFGKTMENLRKRVNVKLLNDKAKLSKLIASPSFDSFRIFSNDLAAVNMKRTKLDLNCPICVGFTILDLSKVLMYQFHYEYLKPTYDCKASLLFTDTDSCYEIKTNDVWRRTQVEKKTAKGIKKSVTKRKLQHATYKECLFEKRQTMASMNQIRSESHEIYSIKLNKTALDPYDEKRYILNDGMSTLDYGHYSTKS